MKIKVSLETLEAMSTKIKLLEKENKKLRKIIKISSIPFELPDDYYESHAYDVEGNSQK